MNLLELAALAEIRNNLMRIVSTTNVPKSLRNVADKMDKVFVENVQKLDLDNVSTNVQTEAVVQESGAVVIQPKLLERDIQAEKGQLSLKFVPPTTEEELREVRSAVNKLSNKQKEVVGTVKKTRKTTKKS